jgi:nucleotide-binding universal stress UspA family protein
MKEILVLVHHDAGQDARLGAAVDLVRRLDGHLTCLDVTKMPATFGTEYAAGALLFEEESRREHRNRDVVQSWLARQEVRWTWQDCVGNLASSVIDAAALADLVILNCKLETAAWPDMRDVTGNVLMHLHIPVIAMPDEVEHLRCDRALVAWDGRPSGAAAMRAAVPLLKLASDVEIFMVDEGRDRIDTDAAVAYLQRHGIAASASVVACDLCEVDDLIREESARFHADYVVMGAYTRGRTAELFGGVTRRMLSNSSLPLLLCR